MLGRQSLVSFGIPAGRKFSTRALSARRHTVAKLQPVSRATCKA
jgi:hypothetical protein